MSEVAGVDPRPAGADALVIVGVGSAAVVFVLLGVERTVGDRRMKTQHGKPQRLVSAPLVREAIAGSIDTGTTDELGVVCV